MNYMYSHLSAMIGRRWRWIYLPVTEPGTEPVSWDISEGGLRQRKSEVGGEQQSGVSFPELCMASIAVVVVIWVDLNQPGPTPHM